jgi:hypothetical protein
MTLLVRGENCHGVRKRKETITDLLCSNSDGSEKFPQLVVGKFVIPRCFKNVRILPCKHTDNSNARMTSEFFKNFLASQDAKVNAQKRNILLFIDKCPARPSDITFLRNIEVVFSHITGPAKYGRLTWG